MTGTGPTGRPLVLTAGGALLVASALPFLALAGSLLGGPSPRVAALLAGLPRPVLDALALRVAGAPAAAVLLGMFGSAYLALAVFTWLGGRRPRTGIALLTGVLDVGLVMVLLAGPPHPGRVICGLAVVLGSLAGLVLAYQPDVERYLGPEDGSVPADERAAVVDAT